MKLDDKKSNVLYELRRNHMTIATAESCTGGLLAGALTDLPGASEVFAGGIVSYWTEAKNSVLGVSQDTLDKYGAVSKETAEEMSVKVKEKFGTSLGISVTGVAGPDPDEKNNPVGRIYIGFTNADDKTIVYNPINLGSKRMQIRKHTVEFALDVLLNYLGGLQ